MGPGCLTGCRGGGTGTAPGSTDTEPLHTGGGAGRQGQGSLQGNLRQGCCRCSSSRACLCHPKTGGSEGRHSAYSLPATPPTAALAHPGPPPAPPPPLPAYSLLHTGSHQPTNQQCGGGRGGAGLSLQREREPLGIPLYQHSSHCWCQ